MDPLTEALQERARDRLRRRRSRWTTVQLPPILNTVFGVIVGFSLSLVAQRCADQRRTADAAREARFEAIRRVSSLSGLGVSAVAAGARFQIPISDSISTALRGLRADVPRLLYLMRRDGGQRPSADSVARFVDALELNLRLALKARFAGGLGPRFQIPDTTIARVDECLLAMDRSLARSLGLPDGCDAPRGSSHAGKGAP